MRSIKVLLSIFLAALMILSGCKDRPKPTEAETTEAPAETTKAPETTKAAEIETPVPHAEVSYDAEKKMVTIRGTGDYESLIFPEEALEASSIYVQDDTYTLLMLLDGLSMSMDASADREFLTTFIARTEYSFYFLRSYMLKHASDPRVLELIGKRADIDCGDYGYGFDNSGKNTLIHLSRGYWLRDYIYMLSLLPSANRGWEQLGFAMYVSFCLDKYNEIMPIMEIDPEISYYQTAVEAGLKEDSWTIEDIHTYFDVVSRYALEKGFAGWGTQMECQSLIGDRFQKRRGSGDWFTGDQKMSMCMAVSFVAWLMDEYGVETVLDFVCELKDFSESFGDSFDNVFENWKTWCRDTYKYVENTPSN